MNKEVVWTYLVAKKYEKNLSGLINKLCCREEKVPNNEKIWLEAYLYPTRIRKEEKIYWKSIADLAIGFFENVSGRKHQLRANGEWICIAESKWFDDIHPNSKYPDIFQFSQLIEHALLLHDINGEFPERVYVTLITPEYFKDQKGPLSEKMYWNKYQDYTTDKKLLENDLRLCPLTFLAHDIDTLINRINSLILNWVTFEDLLGLPNLVEHHIPGKYRVAFNLWEQILERTNIEIYGEIK